MQRSLFLLSLSCVVIFALVPADSMAQQAAAATGTENPVGQNPSEVALVQPRKSDGNGSVVIDGELVQWHKVTLTLDGPFAHEQDDEINPFTDYAFNVTFTHESGSPRYQVPGYFAADGDASETSAASGTKWRAHLSPDKAGKWDYKVSFKQGNHAALGEITGTAIAPLDGVNGSFVIEASDPDADDAFAKGRLQYVGKHYLQFAGSKEYFLKAGPDAPETILGYEDFDNTIAGKPEKVPLKTWSPHLQDWRSGDPTWKDGKGKGLIGAINYLSSKGCNSFSFLTYNAAGDGDNVWPFVQRDDKFHYDCSKLDQWAIVLDHGTSKGMYLHFKMQENEMDDDRRGKSSKSSRVRESLDGGKTGPERKLYCRELIARFGHALALNWNVGEENTQSSDEIRDMVRYLHETDPYHHNIVIHTFPSQQEKVYRPLLGSKSLLTGASLQNSWNHAHQRTLEWVRESADAGRPWVVANDEQGPASEGVPVDPGYQGSDGTGTEKNGKKYTAHDVRKLCLWGTLMAGGAGVEYYFGYQLPENDLKCEDFRSRDLSWDYCRIALSFFSANSIPLSEMANADALVGNEKNDNSKFCFSKTNEVYLVYLPDGGTTHLDLSDAQGNFDVRWFNPRVGGALQAGSVKQVVGGAKAEIGNAPADLNEDWLVVIRNPTPVAPATAASTLPTKNGDGSVAIRGQLKQWHEVSLLMSGPSAQESGGEKNPALDYRMNVVFKQGDRMFVVPGHFAADGDAGQSGAVSGNVWRAYFAPPKKGKWEYKIKFATGPNIAVSAVDGESLEPFDGVSGSFDVAPSDKIGRDFRSAENGMLTMPNNPSASGFLPGNHYLRFQGGNKAWLKGGPNIPENLLGYDGFDNTPDAGHSFAAHEKDWKTGDPDWGDGKGRALVGAFNYLASVGANCVYFLPMNVGGDGNDTFPTVAPQDKVHFDVSKADQWNLLFGHASNLGISLHVVLNETEKENENYHDNGKLGLERKLYYRELVSRFGHHLGIEWDLGEENDYTTEIHQEFAAAIKAIDPYDHPVTTHIRGGKWDETYGPLLGNTNFDKTTFQGGPSRLKMAALMADWRKRSAAAGVPWMISFDEPQRIENDLDDKKTGYAHGRRDKMWPLYMSGGGGFEWYVQEDGRGHGFDQRINDFREMGEALKWTGYALDFFGQLPLVDMKPDHSLATADGNGSNTYVMAKPGEIYAIFNDRKGTGIQLDLSNTPSTDSFEVRWFDPTDGERGFQIGTLETIVGGSLVSVGEPPYGHDQDWAIRVRRIGGSWASPLGNNGVSTPHWQSLETMNKPHARHEAAFVECDGRFYLLGGRGVMPVDIFDPETREWTTGSRPPMEIHHFQPVVWEHRIWLAGAMTGGYPRELSFDRIMIYDPRDDSWSWGPEIPEDRRRGSAGASIHNGHLYLVSGIQNGHWDGWVKWLDRLDLKTGKWEQLPDAPRARDHFQSAFVGDKLYAVGGRRSSASTKQVFDLTVVEVDVFDAAKGEWTTLPPNSNLPTPRAGCSIFVQGTDVLVAGGESMRQKQAHDEIQAFDTTTGKWRTQSLFARGRHGTGVVQWKGTLYTVAGSGGRGGGPELDTTEILTLKMPE